MIAVRMFPRRSNLNVSYAFRSIVVLPWDRSPKAITRRILPEQIEPAFVDVQVNRRRMTSYCRLDHAALMQDTVLIDDQRTAVASISISKPSTNNADTPTRVLAGAGASSEKCRHYRQQELETSWIVVDDVITHANQVLDARSGSRERQTEVIERFFGLSLQVTNADDIACHIERRPAPRRGWS